MNVSFLWISPTNIKIPNHSRRDQDTIFQQRQKIATTHYLHGCSMRVKIIIIFREISFTDQSTSLAVWVAGGPTTQHQSFRTAVRCVVAKLMAEIGRNGPATNAFLVVPRGVMNTIYRMGYFLFLYFKA